MNSLFKYELRLITRNITVLVILGLSIAYTLLICWAMFKSYTAGVGISPIRVIQFQVVSPMLWLILIMFSLQMNISACYSIFSTWNKQIVILKTQSRFKILLPFIFLLIILNLIVYTPAIILGFVTIAPGYFFQLFVISVTLSLFTTLTLIFLFNSLVTKNIVLIVYLLIMFGIPVFINSTVFIFNNPISLTLTKWLLLVLAVIPNLLDSFNSTLKGVNLNYFDLLPAYILSFLALFLNVLKFQKEDL